MNSKFYIFILLISAGFFALSNSNGAGTVQGLDRTGSPVGDGSCATCHTGGNFNPTATITVLQGDTPVTAYQPGQNYTVRISASFDGTPEEFGFQAVALNAENSDVGTWEAGEGYKIVGVNGRDYVEHSPVSSESVFNMSWTAPAEGAGDVSFYSSMCIADNADGSAGDNGAIAEALTLTEDAGSAVNNAGIGRMELSIMPNPVQDVMTYKAVGRDNGVYQMQITDAFGKNVYSEAINLVVGENINTVNMSNLPKGTYVIYVSGENYFAAERLVKL